jgi:hypothetical protein
LGLAGHFSPPLPWREPVTCVLFHYGLGGFHNPLIARKSSKTRLRAEIEERKKAGAWPAEAGILWRPFSHRKCHK